MGGVGGLDSEVVVLGWFMAANKFFTVQGLVAVNVVVLWRNSLTLSGLIGSIGGLDIDLFLIV